MKKIRLAEGLSVPADELASQVVAALGMRGSGKSNIMAVIAEGLLAAGVQVVILDYVGIWPSLRIDASGKKASPFSIPVLGGRNGDIGLVAGGGSKVADTLARTGSSAVLDVSGFTKTARCAFATDLAETLFEKKKEHPSPTFLLLEEAQRFIPQKVFHGQERMLGAFEEIAEVGRNYGLGLGMISQRPQKLAKDVLNLTELLFAFQANGVHERRAIAEWVQEKDAQGRGEVNNELPSLARGEALVWSPSWLRVYGKYHTEKKTTYDAGATPTKARAAMKVRPLDLAQLEASMAEVAEAAKAEDPRALRAEVARLQRELARATKAPAPKAASQAVAHVSPELFRRTVAALSKQAQRLLTDLSRVFKSAEDHLAALDRLGLHAAKRETAAHVPETSPPTAGTTSNGAGHAPARIVHRPAAPPRAAREPGQLGRAERAILTALAQLGGRGSDEQIGIVAGYSVKSSGFENARSALRTAGLIDYQGDVRQLTHAGVEATADVPPLPTGRELLDWWLNSRKLGKCERALLVALWDHGELGREELADRAGYSAKSSGFENAVGALRGVGLMQGGVFGEPARLAPTFLEG